MDQQASFIRPDVNTKHNSGLNSAGHSNITLDPPSGYNISLDDGSPVKQRDGTYFKVLGIPVSITDIDHASQTILDWAKDNIGRFVCIRDVHGVMRAQADEKLMQAHLDADLITPDGAPLALIGKRRGLPVKRTCGSNLMENIMSLSPKYGIKHFLYGGNEGVAEDLKARLEARYPGVKIVGTACPPFRSLSGEEIQAYQKEIAESEADIVWVGLSTPKQEFWMHDNAKNLTATLIGVGAAFDFLTDRQQRAPQWMQNLMLEWLYRFLKEPKRLWYRYLVLVPKFILDYSIDQLHSALRSNSNKL